VTALAAAVGAGVAATAAAGPVAGILVAAYVALVVRGALQRRAGRAFAGARARVLDALCALAADLRAGLPPAAAWPVGARVTGSPGGARVTGSPGDVATADSDAVWAHDERIAHLIGSVWRLAEQSGAPLAELIERIEADARAADRARAIAAAQAAGARATALLLAGLPAGGIALGYAIGADPLWILLHTPLGAGCALAALVLQLAGLTWTDRLTGAPTAAVR
jgi:tight adherence protein B